MFVFKFKNISIIGMPDATITQNDVDKIWDYERMMSLKPLLFKDVMEIQPTYLIYPMENTTIDSPAVFYPMENTTIDSCRPNRKMCSFGGMLLIMPGLR